MNRKCAGLMVLVALAAPAAWGDEPASRGVIDWSWTEPELQVPADDSIYAQATRGARVDGAATPVFTNAYVEELSRDAAPFATEGFATPVDAGARSALDWLFARQARRQERQARIAEAEAEVVEARAKLSNLEIQLLATRNPFSRRPVLSEKEIEYRATSGETALERFERTKLLVEDARAELSSAERALARVERGR